jgi:ribulose-bisphosphate carboxylase large chain
LSKYMNQTPHRPESNERFAVNLRVTVAHGHSIKELAMDIAIEQSIEIPEDCIPDETHERGIVGRIETIEPIPDSKNQFDVTISYRTDNTGFSMPQFLNIVFGNISMKNGIKVTSLDIPDSLLDTFAGPQFGIEGIRAMLGVYNRPLACTAIKPIGLATDKLASMVADYSRGGLDIIKEDHNMADLAYHPFMERVARLQEAVVETNASTGGSTMYFPMVNGGFEEIEKQFARVHSLGIRGVLTAPLLIGTDTVRVLSRRYNLAVLAHPAFTGTHFHDPNHGMTPAVLFGTIFRLMGADVSIFPNAGGRFGFTHQECLDVADALKKPLGKLKPAFPCAAGGMKLNLIGAMAETFGADSVLLIGGALMQNSKDLAKNAAEFMDGIRQHFKEERRLPR